MLTRDGYELLDLVLAAHQCEHVAESLPGAAGPGLRNLIDHPAVIRLARSERLRALLRATAGEELVAVKATLFDKSDEANWRVQWHQDRLVAVKERLDVEGYGPWSVKGGVVHVEPPAEVLARMVALRIHLDDCGPDNGPLRVIPRSHRSGKLTAEEIARVAAAGPVAEVYAPRGAILLMRPLLVHSSPPAAAPRHRRVLHIELAPPDAIAPLQWHRAVTSAPAPPGSMT